MARFEIAKTLPNEVKQQDVVLPKRSTKNSAGYDLVSPVDAVVPAYQTFLIPTGVTCKMEEDEYLAIVPRSGLALKKGITILNTPGIVDSDYYPNSVGVLLYNISGQNFIVNKGDRIAQAILQNYQKMENDVEPTVERTAGYGSTGGM